VEAAAASVGTNVVGTLAVDPLLAPALALAPMQLLAHRLAVRAGRSPGVLLHATKTTTRE
jgi:glucosamine 6-phosphate synthetase-like amidotransferase/phosphosugar isomerase protein